MKNLKLNKKYSYEEYLKVEEETNEKHDFHFGELYNMAGSTKRHNKIVNALFLNFYENNNSSCEIFTEDIKLEIIKNEFYVYPDLMITCDEKDLENEQDSIVRKPILVAEVLSNSTALYDRNVKLKHYLSLPSLKYYMLISQSAVHLELYEKNELGFQYSFYQNIEDIIELKQMGITISVKDIYRLVKMD